MTLAGRRALVTGGSRGIGRAVTRRLATAGAEVVFSYVRNQAESELLVAELAAEGKVVHAIQADLTELNDLNRLFDTADELLGGLDVLVNNAAGSLVSPIGETTEKDYDALMALNTKATFFAMQRAARCMAAEGRIINVSTVNTVRHFPGVAVYAASKAAVEQFTMVAAVELGRRGITVNTVSPGPVDTDMLRGGNSQDALDLAVMTTPLRRLGQPADIADVIGFLAGPDARWITGQNIRVSGGFT